MYILVNLTIKAAMYCSRILRAIPLYPFDNRLILRASNALVISGDNGFPTPE